MKHRSRYLLLPLIACAATQATAQIQTAPISLVPLGTYATGVFNAGAQEIAAYDAASRRLFVVNANAVTVDALDIGNPAAPTKVFGIDATPYGGSANSVATGAGAVAVAVEAAVKTDPGKVVFFSNTGAFLAEVTVGALPDMLTFTPDQTKVLVCNEGEPSDDYLTDPEGSVSIVDVSGGVSGVTQANVTTATFTAWNGTPIHAGIRIFGPGATIAMDLEPEYLTVSPDGTTAWVTLQENNAIAVLDVASATFVDLLALGTKDHRVRGRGLDPSDRDGAVAIGRWPVEGMYMPDAIASYVAGGQTLLVTANEGDSRGYTAFTEDDRVKNLVLDPTRFPNAAALQADAALGRLTVTTAHGDADGDGDMDALYAFGARSFSIWGTAGNLVWDSGDALERKTALAYPAEFNSDHAANQSFDSRSDNKGPEPEGVALATISGRTFAFIGLERIGGIVVYEITNPLAPTFLQYVNTRLFAGDPALGTAGDLGPEGLLYIPGPQSPIGQPLLVVANEISGTTTVFKIKSRIIAP